MRGVALAALLMPVLDAAVPRPNRAALKMFGSAITLYERAEYDAALSRFNKAMVLFPGWKTASGYRALCRWTMGDAPGAVSDAEGALKLKPNDAQSFIGRGDARLVTRDYP